MGFLRQFTEDFITNMHGRALGQGNAGFLFQFHQHIIEPVVFEVAHDFPAFLVVGLRCLVQQNDQVLHLFDFFFLIYNLFRHNCPPYTFLIGAMPLASFF